jgi:hypothetical protein
MLGDRSRRARGAWLAGVRGRLNLTQAQMAPLLGKTTNTIARLERGEQLLDATTEVLVGYVARDRGVTPPPAPGRPNPPGRHRPQRATGGA